MSTLTHFVALHWAPLGSFSFPFVFFRFFFTTTSTTTAIIIIIIIAIFLFLGFASFGRRVLCHSFVATEN